ncbi:protein of unknown function [Mucilaginibacter pineti]|uniref:Fibronectin type-III domain-containing protein n=1 Tax=Mucilaginibacter pineti TaxID=1391627 RepID=A0A1G7D6J1_9SPHI|nr:DUF4959 domain-containing protein [Mucilaginibacter pineti]SDE47182.1 protein of unknown function [Mucilaginibacter pineti]
MKKINNRRYLTWLVLAPVLLIMLFSSCKKAESNIQVVSDDKTKPGPITNVKVENLNGSARLTYTLPDSKNLLYVLARYNINDTKSRETKASYYTDTIVVDGFARAKDYTVTLYAVSRANIMSDPVTVTVSPLTPNYLLVNTNFAITPDFGGANFFGLNPNKVPIAVHIITYNDAIKGYDDIEPKYLSTDTVNISVDGYAATPRKFGVYTTDRFGNISDTVFTTLTPLFAIELDKTKFATYHLGTDSPIGYGWEFRYFFDGNLGDPGWHTLSAPLKIGTFSLGVRAKISSLKLYNRLPDIYGYQNSRMFTIWGSDVDAPGDYPAWPAGITPVGTVLGDWVNMGNFVYPNPPSGLPANQANASDIQFGADGVSFKMPITAPAVRFIRFQCTQTWAGLDYVHAKEITLFGDPSQ